MIVSMPDFIMGLALGVLTGFGMLAVALAWHFRR